MVRISTHFVAGNAAGGLLAIAASCLLEGGLSVLMPGIEVSECRSALRLGPLECDSDAPSKRATEPSTRRGDDPSLEAQVDRYLQEYGKPPREAVRALLDPTDENVRAMLRKQEESLAIAAYVADRMTALQQEEWTDAPGAARDRAQSLLPFLQLRITLLARIPLSQARPALHALQDLAEQVPSLQVRVGLVGPVEAQALKEALAELRAPLTVTLVEDDSSASDQLPRLRIEDLRQRRHWDLDARDLTPQGLRAFIIQARSSRLDSEDPRAAREASVQEAAP